MALLIKDFIEIEKLAHSGIKDVYTATQVSFNRKVVIKKIPYRLFSSQSQIERFANGARLSTPLDHDNIVRVYDFGQDKDAFYFVMEYIDGQDLEKLFSWKPFPWQIGLLIAVQALKGLNFAHKKDVAHGDFKPTNILVSKTGQVKVADFCLAHPGPRELFETEENSRFITAAYMSPEVAKQIEEIETGHNELPEISATFTKSTPPEGRPALEGKDFSRDIWSAGVLLYRVFSGQLPFPGETASEVAQSIKNSREPIFFHFMPFLPDDCAKAVNSCLVKESKNRLVSLDPLIASLENLIFDIGFRDYKKEIQKYANDKYSAINDLEKVIIGYHSRMAVKCSQSGDSFKQAAHVTELEKLNNGDRDIALVGPDASPDLTVQNHATNFFIREDPEPKKWTSLLKPRSLKILIAIIIIVIASTGLGIFFTTLQNNPSGSNEEHSSVQKAEIAAPQTAQAPANPGLSVPDTTAKPTPVPVETTTPVEATAPQLRNVLPKETRPASTLSEKSNGHHTNSKNKTTVKPITKAAPGNSAILKVNLKPSFAILTVDEKEVSLQDIINGKSVKPGLHAVSASAPGYESYQSAINLEPGVKQILDISLTQTEKGAGLLHVYSYPWAELYVDGVSQGTTPTAKPLSFPEGDHEIQLRRDGFKTYSKTVNLEKGQVTHVKIDLQKLDTAAH
jgi:serine/threonine protein kinase